MKKKTKEKKGKTKNRLINLLLFLMLLLGLALIFNNQIKYFLINMMSNKYGTEHYTVGQLEKNANSKQSFDYSKIKSVSTSEVLAAQMDNADLPVVGQIAIPVLKVHLPIFKGMSNKVLLYGAGTMKEDQKMGEGNYSLASHKVEDPKLLFSPLEWAEEGQMIYITDLKKIYKYKTVNVKRVEPRHIEVIDDVPGKKLITLVTCDDFEATRRVIVRGELEDVKTLEEATEDMKKAMKTHINQVKW